MAAEHVTVAVQQAAPYRARAIEMCEHKGLGHPDTITDGACEAAALALAQAYRRICGRVLHFNVDKGLLVAGRSEPRFGGGRVVEPAKLIVCGRASNPDGEMDVASIVTSAAEQWLNQNIGTGAQHFRILPEIKEGSASLKQLYAGGAAIRRANDTSFGVGFAPLTALEQQVLELAALLRSQPFHLAVPAAGDDFKIMGLRTGERYFLTVALAMIDRHVSDVAHYCGMKDEILRHLHGKLSRPADLVLNALDDPRASDESGLHLTVTGLSAEMGDDGQVGRGNRVNGLITPGRPMSLEAAAGKNPSSHVGKIYNVLAHSIAHAVCAQVKRVEEANVQLLSTIGQPLNRPRIALVEVAAGDGLPAAAKNRVASIVDQQIQSLDALIERLVQGEASVY